MVLYLDLTIQHDGLTGCLPSFHPSCFVCLSNAKCTWSKMSVSLWRNGHFHRCLWCAMEVLLRGVNITFNFSKNGSSEQPLQGFVGAIRWHFELFLSLFTSSTRHLQNTWHDWLCQSCWHWTEQKPSLSLPGLSAHERQHSPTPTPLP